MDISVCSFPYQVDGFLRTFPYTNNLFLVSPHCNICTCMFATTTINYMAFPK